MTMMVWSGWDENEVVKRCRGALEQCCWSWSKSWSSGVVWEALTGPA